MGRTLRRHRRSIAVLLSAAVAGLSAPYLTGTAVAADRAAAKANSRWLADQLGDDGTLQNPLGGTLPDHGLMIDALFAMHASGDAELAAPIVRYLDEGEHASDYFTWDGLVPDQGFDAIITGGAAAKVLVAAQVARRDPRDFGGYDMVAETKGAIMRSGPDKGRVSDYSKNPDYADYVSNNANMFGQALAVIGLAGVGENDPLAIDTMLTQQCSEGYFRIFFGYIPTEETGDHVTPSGYKVSTCDEGKAFDQSAPDGDTTGFALSAMLAARKAGAQGLDGPIGKTVAWLKANQTEGGGWGGGVNTEAPNTNSTGLIVQALAEAGGADAAVAAGVDYLKSAQATTAADSGNMLADHIGAIAYNPDQYRDARTGGLAGLDTWIRAGAQASLGLSQVGFHALTQGDVPAGEDPPGEDPPGEDPPGEDPPGGKDPVKKPPIQRAGDPGPPPASPSGGNGVSPPSSANQPGPAAPAARLGRYLVGKLVGGDHIEVTENGKTFVDYDATADLVLALRALDEQPQAVARATRFLLHPDSVKAYAHGAPYEKGTAAYAEPLAKLQIIARFAQGSGGAPEGVAATITRLHDALVALRTADGRFADIGAYADADTSVRRQAWAILATTAGSATAATSLDVLIRSRCADGTFPADLAARSCATGDLTATAAAVMALNGTARAASATPPVAAPTPSGAVPTGWSPARAAALTAAVTALTAKSTAAGVVLGAGGRVDAVLSAAVASGRQAAGLDASGTTQALGALLLADGGLAKPPGTGSDVPTSIAAAPGVAGRAWTSAPGSPVTPAVRLPVAGGTPPPTTTALARAGGEFPAGPVIGGLVLAVALGFGLRHLLFRKPSRKPSRKATSKGVSA
ncbi:serine/threonine-protein kinase [Actinomadura craniellae]|uniref:hypothetical protein n=1 Tax=Actinomadura craniellae TaxID=2231787 RepID=UPI0013141849|nr:hypothetical protein [Actinomadura craniellae]